MKPEECFSKHIQYDTVYAKYHHGYSKIQGFLKENIHINIPNMCEL